METRIDKAHSLLEWVGHLKDSLIVEQRIGAPEALRLLEKFENTRKAEHLAHEKLNHAGYLGDKEPEINKNSNATDGHGQFNECGYKMSWNLCRSVQGE